MNKNTIRLCVDIETETSLGHCVVFYRFSTEEKMECGKDVCAMIR